MALTVVRPCVVCNAPMETKRSTKQTCSDRCTKAHYRATKKIATPHKIKEEVTPSMSTSQLFQPDAAHLKALQDIAVNLYRNAVQCNIDGMQVMGMTETFEVKTLQATLDKYVELLSQGYKPTDRVADMPKLIPHPVIDYVVLSLQKPDTQVEKEVDQIKAEVEADYLEKLAQAKAAAVAREVESKIRGARDKKAQAEAAALKAVEAAEYAAIEAEVLAALGGK